MPQLFGSTARKGLEQQYPIRSLPSISGSA